MTWQPPGGGSARRKRPDKGDLQITPERLGELQVLEFSHSLFKPYKNFYEKLFEKIIKDYLPLYRIF
jgi:hypothetical protein